jgi:hypothetical protein
VWAPSGGPGVTGWTVTWTYANGQTMSNAYNASVTQSGAKVTATNMSYNGTIAAGASTQFGGGGTWSGTNTAPVLTCTAAGSSATTTTGGNTTTTFPPVLTTEAPPFTSTTASPTTSTTAPRTTITTTPGALYLPNTSNGTTVSVNPGTEVEVYLTGDLGTNGQALTCVDPGTCVWKWQEPMSSNTAVLAPLSGGTDAQGDAWAVFVAKAAGNAILSSYVACALTGSGACPALAMSWQVTVDVP